MCPRSCFCVQQEFEYPISYKAGTPRVPTFTNSHLPKRFTQEGDKQNNFAKAVSLADKILSFRRIKISNSRTLI